MKRLITGFTVILFSATCAAADVKPTELGNRIPDTADPEATLAHMHALRQQRGWQELADQFAEVDFSEWPAESVGQTVEALRLRGQAYAFTNTSRIGKFKYEN
jgi:hypothetical protein